MIEIENLELRQLKLVKMLNSVSSLLNHLERGYGTTLETPYVVSYLHYQVQPLSTSKLKVFYTNFQL